MKTPEEIKKGLESCSRQKGCAGKECPYYGPDYCLNPMDRDALALIQQLEERIELMKIQMQGDCGVCKHWNSGKCDECLKNTGRPHWEYEGLPETAKEEIK